MAGNRKHGFRRGNANGRNGTNTPPKWYCDGCNKLHGGHVFRTKTLKGRILCERQYFKEAKNNG